MNMVSDHRMPKNGHYCCACVEPGSQPYKTSKVAPTAIFIKTVPGQWNRYKLPLNLYLCKTGSPITQTPLYKMWKAATTAAFVWNPVPKITSKKKLRLDFCTTIFCTTVPGHTKLRCGSYGCICVKHIDQTKHLKLPLRLHLCRTHKSSKVTPLAALLKDPVPNHIEWLKQPILQPHQSYKYVW